MTSRHPARARVWRRVIAVALGTAVTGGGLLAIPSQAAPGQAAPSSALSSALSTASASIVDRAAADPVPVPTADILDVDFSGAGGKAVDHSVHTRVGTTRGSVALQTDTTLKKPVMKVAANTNGIAFDITDAWFGAPTIKTTASFECVFRLTGSTLPASEQDLCSGKQVGGFGLYATSTGVGIMGHIGGAYQVLLVPATGGTWYDLVAVYSGSQLLVYLNGNLAGTLNVSGAVKVPVFTGSKGYWMLGADANASGNAELGANASIAAAKIFSGALTAEQVDALATENGLNDTPPAATEYDELSADVLDVDFADGTATDRAQSLAAATYGSPIVTDDSALGRKVATFDGVEDAFTYPFGDQWPKVTAGATIECFFRHDGTLAGEHDVCSNLQVGGYSIATVDGDAAFIVYVGGAYKTLKAPIKNGVWYHVVGVYNGQELKLYLNGELAAVSRVTGKIGLPTSTARSWVIGADSTTPDKGDVEKFAPATVALARVYSKPASPTLVAELSSTAFAGSNAHVELTSSVPATGARLTAPVHFQPNFTNPGNARDWSYQLDGTDIEPGERIGAGLAAGEHEIVITATDVLGSARTWTIRFTSASIPLAGSSGTQQGNGKVTLSTTSTSPDDEDVTTTYYVAAPTVAEGGIQGSVPVLPSSLSFTYTDASTIVGEMLPDDQTATSASSATIPFQRFDIPAAQAPGQKLLWNGVVDPARAVSMRAWNVATSTWVELDTSRGVADAQTSMSGQFTADYLDDGVVHVLVTGEDPFSDDLAPRGAAAAADEDHFAADDAYDFSMVHYTDTQYITEGAAGGAYNDLDGIAEASDVEQEAERLVWEQAWTKEIQWMTDHREDKRIVYAAHTGDVIENMNSSVPAVGTEREQQVFREFDQASGYIEPLDESGIIDQTIGGNHDTAAGTQTGASSYFSRYFSPNRYYDTAADSWPEGASFHTMDETTNPDGTVATRGKDSQNNYVLFSAGGLDFVAVGLSYGVTQPEADWAASVFARYSDRNGILLTHAYLMPSSSPDARDANFSVDGARLYNTVVVNNPNVFLVLTGHEHGVGTNIRTNVGPKVDSKHNVVELLADYQFYTVSAGELFTKDRCATCVRAGNAIDVNGDGVTDHAASDQLQFGASFLRLLQVDVDRSEMIIDTYSPLLDDFGAREYDGRNRYNGAEDNLVVPIDLSSRTTSFATDSLMLITPTDEVIGTTTVPSGAESTIRWNRLVPGRVYAWTASTSADPRSGEFMGTLMVTPDGVDTVAPVLTVPATTSIVQGTVFDPMEGVSAIDAVDGDLTDQVVVEGSVDIDIPGDYTIGYSVTDANGNQAQAGQTLTVQPAPELIATQTSSSSVTATYGEEATFSATVTPATATGTVMFLTGEDVWCQAAIVDGTATCTTPTLIDQGTFEVTATYLGDAEHAGSSQIVYLTVGEQVPVSLTGAVTAAGSPVAGACVYLYAGVDAPSASFASCSDGEGSFVVTGVAPGDYTVAVVDPSGRYLTWWSPDPVTVDGDTAPLAITLSAPAPGAVTGTVSDGSAPLGGICAFAYPTGQSDRAAYASCTTVSGGYGMYGVDAGDYELAFFDPSGSHPTQWWTGSIGGAADQGDAVAVAVRDGVVTSGVDAVLAAPGRAVLRGTVTDASGPVQGACVYLYEGAAGPASYATCTDVDGGYWLPFASAGSYKVAIADPSDAHATQWWTGSPGGANSYADATVVSGDAGATVTADVVLDAPVTGGVAGSVTSTGGGDVDSACVFLYATGTTTSASYASCAQTDGTYLVPSAKAGDYQVAFFDPAAGYATQWWTGTVGGAAAQELSVPVTVTTTVRSGIDAVLAPVA